MSADTQVEERGVNGLGEVDEPAFSGLAQRGLPADGTE